MSYGATNILAKGPCRNSRLEELSLINNSLGLEELTDTVEMLQTSVKLKRLILSCNPLGSGGVARIAKALGSKQRLELLCLMNTECHDEGAAALAEMLRRNKTLEVLYLCNEDRNTQHRSNIIGDNGATALARVLKYNNSSLRELHLCRNTRITSTGLRELIESVQKNKTLTLYIDLPEQISMTLDDETMKRIRPGCNVRLKYRQGKIT